VFVGFSRIFLLGILIFKRLTARRLYKSFGVKGLREEEELIKQLSWLLYSLVILATIHAYVIVLCQNLLRILSAGIVLEVFIRDLESAMAYVLRQLRVCFVTVFPPMLSHVCRICSSTSMTDAI
jgi:hypothetical protein